MKMSARAMEGEVIFSQKNSDDDDKEDVEKKQRPIIKSATDLQRLKLEKLMKNPEKLVNIPELPKDKDYMNSVPSFVRNVMGSSAGAGSGEFHVYRHLRRKEYARQKAIQYKSHQEELNDEHATKMEENRKLCESKTAKKRAKRQKRKQKMRENRKKPKTDVVDKESEEEEEEDDDDEDSDGKEKTIEDVTTEQDIKVPTEDVVAAEEQEVTVKEQTTATSVEEEPQQTCTEKNQVEDEDSGKHQKDEDCQGESQDVQNKE